MDATSLNFPLNTRLKFLPNLSYTPTMTTPILSIFPILATVTLPNLSYQPDATPPNFLLNFPFHNCNSTKLANFSIVTLLLLVPMHGKMNAIVK